MKIIQLTYQHSKLGKRISFHPTKKSMWGYYAAAKDLVKGTEHSISHSTSEEILLNSVQSICDFLNKKILEIQRISKEWR